MAKIENTNEEDLSNVQFYGFEDGDLFSGTKEHADKPMPNLIKEYDKSIVDLSENDNNNNVKKVVAKPLLTESDLYDVIEKGTTGKLNYGGEANKPVSNLIKKNDSKAQNVLDPLQFHNDFSKNYSISKSEWSEIADDFENNDILNDDFLDFIELPKISGDERNFVGKNLIAGEHIHSSNKKVEISDNPVEGDSSHSTSIEINRTENGDIESITVYCKCGEFTNIRFDYDEGNSNDETEFFQTSGTLDPLKLPHIKTQNPK
jgi:hypothetical protein